MPASNRTPHPIPENFETLADFDRFWSTHVLTDYEADLETVDIEVRLDDQPTGPETVPLSADLAERLRRCAHEQGVSVHELLDRIVATALAR